MLLAAGAGRRMGWPKATIVNDEGTPWVVTSVRALREGGCDDVTVVLGAAVEKPCSWLSESDVTVVAAADWAEGMGASLRAGLAAVGEAEAAVVHLVDLPDVGAPVVSRLIGHAAGDALARADYGHGPAHPVLIGREHFAGVLATARGDRGARDYLRGRAVLSVDCSDLATGRDADTPGDL